MWLAVMTLCIYGIWRNVAGYDDTVYGIWRNVAGYADTIMVS